MRSTIRVVQTKSFVVLLVMLPVLVCASAAWSAEQSPLIESAWLDHEILIDARIYPPQTEWSEAPYVDLILGKGFGTDPPFINMRVWAINDDEFLYLLYRVEYPEEDVADGDYLFVYYLWPSYDPAMGWEHSDCARWSIDNALDLCCYDDSRAFGAWWLDDAEGTPAGENDVDAAMSYDSHGQFYWGEMKKPLRSNDAHDWDLELGQTYPRDDGVIVMGFFSLSQLGLNTRVSLTLAAVPDRPTTNGNGNGGDAVVDISWSIELIATVVTIGGAAVGLGGWFLAEWRDRKRKRAMFQEYLDEIDSVHVRFKMNARECEAELIKLKDVIKDEFRSEMLDPDKYKVLDNRIDEYLAEIRQEIVQDAEQSDSDPSA